MRAALRSLALLGVIVVLVSGCRGDDVVASMAEFDRAYIPALILTSEKDTSGRSVMAMKQLKLGWSIFKGRNPEMVAEGGPATGIEDIVMDADGLMNGGRYKEAHREIEKIRDILYRLRSEAGISYFPDRLTEFHAVMERLLEKGGDTDKMVALVPEALAAWKAVEEAPFVRKHYRFSKDMEKALRKRITAVSEALKALGEAAGSGSGKEAAMMAREVRKGFSDVYSMFGNFGGASL